MTLVPLAERSFSLPSSLVNTWYTDSQMKQFALHDAVDELIRRGYLSIVRTSTDNDDGSVNVKYSIMEKTNV